MSQGKVFLGYHGMVWDFQPCHALPRLEFWVNFGPVVSLGLCPKPRKRYKPIPGNRGAQCGYFWFGICWVSIGFSGGQCMTIGVGWWRLGIYCEPQMNPTDPTGAQNSIHMVSPYFKGVVSFSGLPLPQS